MRLRPEAEFRPDFPYDRGGDETDVLAGRGMTEAIGAMLRSLGYDVSEPMHAGEHGWELEVRKGRRFWLQISWFEKEVCRLTAFDVTWKFWRRRPGFKEFLTQLDDALRQDGRFHQIGWFKDWRDSSRSSHPVAAD